MAADSRLEHGDPAVQPGPVPRGREVVRPRHELPPPPGDPAGELRETGSAVDTTGLKFDNTENSLQVFFEPPSLCVCACRCLCSMVKC